MGTDVVVMVLSRDLLNHSIEQDKPIVAVFETTSRLKSQRSIPKELDVILMRMQFSPMLIKYRTEEIPSAPCMT
jgi:hypothetical protein